jgi:hypothetical protein
MSEIEKAATFVDVCSKGHRLFGIVSYCPFCGVEVTPAVATKPKVPVLKEEPVVTEPLNARLKPIFTDTSVGTTKVAETEEQVEEDPEFDPLYDKAVAIVLKTHRPSISSLQRQLRIGYNRTARMIERMERDGLVTSMQNDGNREVLGPKAKESKLAEPKATESSVTQTKAGGLPKWILVVIGLVVIFVLFKMNNSADFVSESQTLADAIQSLEPLPEPMPELASNPLPEGIVGATPEPIFVEPSSEPTPVAFSEPEPKAEPEPIRQQSLADCPAENIAATTHSQLSGQKWVQASQFINQQLEKHATCATNKDLLMLQDLALELKKYTREHNPRSAKSGFESLIDKYGDKQDLTKMRDFFNKVLNEENDCAASGGNWNSNNFSCN